MDCQIADQRALRTKHKQVKPTTYPNNTLADIEKGPTFHIDEAAVQAGPAGRNALVHGLESAEDGDPE
eukprot:15434000-Alexandrium_andersonii.AAC.1